MQTLPSLRSVRALRAVFLGPSPSRRRTPSAARRAGMGGASALPHPPGPTEPVGSHSAAVCSGTEGTPVLPNPPRPTCAVGSRAAAPRRSAGGDRRRLRAGRRGLRQRDRCPRAGAGPLPARAVRWARIGVPFSADPRQRGARTSGPQWALSAGLSLHPRPQPFGGRSEGGGTGGALVRRQIGNSGNAGTSALVEAAAMKMLAGGEGAPTRRAAWRWRVRPVSWQGEARVLPSGPPPRGR